MAKDRITQKEGGGRKSEERVRLLSVFFLSGSHLFLNSQADQCPGHKQEKGSQTL